MRGPSIQGSTRRGVERFEIVRREELGRRRRGVDDDLLTARPLRTDIGGRAQRHMAARNVGEFGGIVLRKAHIVAVGLPALRRPRTARR